MPRVPITDLDDPRIAIYRNLKATNRTRSSGQFVVEGEKLLDRLLASPFPVASVLAGDRHEARVAAKLPPEVPLYVRAARIARPPGRVQLPSRGARRGGALPWARHRTPSRPAWAPGQPWSSALGSTTPRTLEP